MNEPLITIVGTAVADPELRFLPSGVAVANMTVAVTPRVKKGETWEDGETIWFRLACWRQLAESVAESIVKGTRVIASGRLSARSYETKSGEKRTDMEIQVDSIGPELRFATAKVNRVERGSDRSTQHASNDDPWGSSAPSDAPF
jgi:single-strand DNA-binding protein